MRRMAVISMVVLVGLAGCSSGGGEATPSPTTAPAPSTPTTTPPTSAEPSTTTAVEESDGDQARLLAMFTSQGYTDDEASCMVASMQRQADTGPAVDDRTLIATAVGDCDISDERIAELQAGASSGSVEDQWASALQSAGLDAEQARCAASEFVDRYGETTDIPPAFDGDAIAEACGFDPAILG